MAASNSVSLLSEKEDKNIFRRLLRDVFSDILSLKDRLKKLEAKVNGKGSTSLSKPTLSGKLNYKVALKKNDSANFMSQIFDSKPQLVLNLNLPIEGSNSEISFQVATRPNDLTLKLDKVVVKKVMFGGGLRLFLAPNGACGEDFIPTMNPNAGGTESGLCSLISKGCPVHQRINNASGLGLRLGGSGNELASALFLNKGSFDNQISMTLMNQAILTPNRNVTFAVFRSQNQTNTHNFDNRFTSFGIPLLPSENIENSTGYGALGAVNIKDKYVLSGWWSIKNENYRHKWESDSFGLCLSSHSYPNAVCPKIGMEITNCSHGRVGIFEFSSKFASNGQIDFCPGVVAAISILSPEMIYTACGFKTEINF